MIEEEAAALDLNIKVIEKPGRKLIDELKSYEKNERQFCDADEIDNCMMCHTEGAGSCRKSEIVYKMECKECPNGTGVYIGESHRNGYSRSKEHLADAKSSVLETREKSVILRHSNEKHAGKVTEFTMKKLKVSNMMP